MPRLLSPTLLRSFADLNPKPGNVTDNNSSDRISIFTLHKPSLPLFSAGFLTGFEDRCLAYITTDTWVPCWVKDYILRPKVLSGGIWGSSITGPRSGYSWHEWDNGPLANARPTPGRLGHELDVVSLWTEHRSLQDLIIFSSLFQSLTLYDSTCWIWKTVTTNSWPRSQFLWCVHGIWDLL